MASTKHPSVPEGVRPYMLPAGIGVTGFDASVKAAGSSTGGGLTLIESRTRGGAPRHVHTREDEYFYVLEGSLAVACGEETFEAGPGAFVSLPRGIPHGWDVIGEEAALLMFTVPAMLEEFLQEYHAATGAARDRVAAKYGITFFREDSEEQTKKTADSSEYDPISRIRSLCMALPEAVEQPFGGHTAPSFRVGGKLFVSTYEDGSAMICKAPPGVQQALVGSDAARFFVPAYVGNKGWVGARLDVELDWEEIAELIEDSYRLIAPKRLSSLLTRP